MVITIDLALVSLIVGLLTGAVSLYALGQFLVNMLVDKTPIGKEAKELLNLLDVTKNLHKWTFCSNFFGKDKSLVKKNISTVSLKKSEGNNLRESFSVELSPKDNKFILQAYTNGYEEVALNPLFTKKELSLLNKKLNKLVNALVVRHNAEAKHKDKITKQLQEEKRLKDLQTNKAKATSQLAKFLS